MYITIAERLRPFSHLPGTLCPIPGTSLAVQVFPSKICLYSLATATPAFLREIDVALPCPMKEFSVMVDIERPSIAVWGWCEKIFVRYRIVANTSKDDIVIMQEKGPEWLFLATQKQSLPTTHFERLSLGCHKKQDWELVRRRNDLKEILPHWFALGQLAPQSVDRGGESLLNDARKAIVAREPDAAAKALLSTFQAGFQTLLAPQLIDSNRNGFAHPPVDAASPLVLLSEGAKLIRSLFFSVDSNRATILPCLPTMFHCGRVVDLVWEGKGLIDMEWTKKLIRRLHFKATADGIVTFQFSKEMVSFRLWADTKDKGRRLKCGESFEVKAGKVYRIDRFEK